MSSRLRTVVVDAHDPAESKTIKNRLHIDLNPEGNEFCVLRSREGGV